MNDEDSDEALMLRYQAGDAAAFDELYARHRGGLYRFITRQCRVRERAEEIFQDVWMSLIQAAERYRVEAQFRTWLFTMAHNRVIDHFRTAKNHVRLDDEDPDTQGCLAETLAADSGFGPVRQLESREQAAALIAAVEQLPIDQREAFLLQAEAGMNVREIALATGVNFETAKSRLRYARRSLRQLLQEFA